MKYEQYFSLIKNLEKDAKENPRSYKFRVTAIAFLGYAYFLLIAVVPVAIIFLIALFLWVYPRFIIIALQFLGKLIWLIGLLAVGLFSAFGGALKALFTQATRPEGYELRREEAEKLFRTVEEVSEKIGSPMPDHVLVSPEFNASVHTFPRFGFLGKVNYLNIGLPLMQAISPEHFRSVLAHEMGHISRKHGSDAAWIYQLRETWARFLEKQETDGNGAAAFLYSKFVNWYFPYFNAYSFVLARQQEREADLMAVEFYGKKSLAEALMNVEVKAHLLQQDFWKEVFDEAKTTPIPPKQTFSRMTQHFRSERDEAKEIIALSKALAIRTDYHDTHPSLNERLKLLGYETVEDNPAEFLSETPVETAAQAYLGNLTEKLSEKFDREWLINVTPIWQEQHEYFDKANRRLKALETKAGTEKLSEEELFELAQLEAVNKDYNAATPILKEILEKNPDQLNAQFDLACILLENGDEKGIEMLEEVMRRDVFFTVSACELIYIFLHAKGDEEKALSYLNKAETFNEELVKAESERQNVNDWDNFEAHDLPDEKVRAIADVAAYHEEITAAYLVKKQVRYFPEKPCYVLGIERKKKWFKSSGDVSDANLLEVVANQVGKLEVHYVVILGKNFKDARREIKAIPNSKIY